MAPHAVFSPWRPSSRGSAPFSSWRFWREPKACSNPAISEVPATSTKTCLSRLMSPSAEAAGHATVLACASPFVTPLPALPTTTTQFLTRESAPHPPDVTALNALLTFPRFCPLSLSLSPQIRNQLRCRSLLRPPLGNRLHHLHCPLHFFRSLGLRHRLRQLHDGFRTVSRFECWAQTSEHQFDVGHCASRQAVCQRQRVCACCSVCACCEVLLRPAYLMSVVCVSVFFFWLCGALRKRDAEALSRSF